MFENNRILVIIPARGGSKGIPDKNIKELNGKPLIAYTIEAALKSKYTDRVIVTTDSKVIAEISKKYGAEVPFMRSDELASDTARSIDVELHAIEMLESSGSSFDVAILAQPTSPLRDFKDFDEAIEMFFKRGMCPLVAVSPVSDHPLLIRSVDKSGKLKNLLDVESTCRRQDMPIYYKVNGALYINKIEELTPQTSLNDNKVPYIMEKNHSTDIDSLSDFQEAEYYLSQIV